MNKKGWSLVSELIVMLIAVVLLIYAVFGLNRLGLVRDINKAVPIGVNPDLIISGKVSNYGAVEEKIVNATKKYISDKYNDDFVGEQVVVRISHLVKNGYIGTIRDANNKTCSGYVKVIKNKYDISYNPYLKCDKYTSIGYESEYDW